MAVFKRGAASVQRMTRFAGFERPWYSLREDFSVRSGVLRQKLRAKDSPLREKRRAAGYAAVCQLGPLNSSTESSVNDSERPFSPRGEKVAGRPDEGSSAIPNEPPHPSPLPRRSRQMLMEVCAGERGQ
jgi:hypothetical protein